MDLDDNELVSIAKASTNDDAFSELVRRHQARLRAFLRRLCGSDALADDIAQDSFMKAHTGLSKFRGRSSFRSWLYAIAYREFLQDHRKEKAAARLEEALQREAQQTSADNSEMMDANLSIDLRRALLTLEEMERAALLLCDAAGLSHSEAALAIGAPLGSVKTYVARGRKKMREALSRAPAPQGENIIQLNPAKEASHAV